MKKWLLKFATAATLPRSLLEPLALDGESEFLAAANGECGDAVWRIMDELAETVKMLHPRVYESVIRKLNDI